MRTAHPGPATAIQASLIVAVANQQLADRDAASSLRRALELAAPEGTGGRGPGGGAGGAAQRAGAGGAALSAQLYVSLNTVKTHIKSIYRKLDTNRRWDAVKRARQLQLL